MTVARDGKVIAWRCKFHIAMSFHVLCYQTLIGQAGPICSAAAILKKSLILGDTPTRGITRYHLCNLKQKNVFFLETVVVVK